MHAREAVQYSTAQRGRDGFLVSGVCGVCCVVCFALRGWLGIERAGDAPALDLKSRLALPHDGMFSTARIGIPAGRVKLSRGTRGALSPTACVWYLTVAWGLLLVRAEKCWCVGATLRWLTDGCGTKEV